MWTEGEIKIQIDEMVYKFIYEAKIYGKPSNNGVYNSNVSKLIIYDSISNKCLYHYDRGPVIRASSHIVKAAVHIVLEKYSYLYKEET